MEQIPLLDHKAGASSLMNALALHIHMRAKPCLLYTSGSGLAFQPLYKALGHKSLVSIAAIIGIEIGKGQGRG